MEVTLWGTRGSLPVPGPETARYGGNTSCVEVRGADGTVLILDAGSGIRRLGAKLLGTLTRVDILLTHLHMDHIQGLGFFAPLYTPGLPVHIWGPASPALQLHTRLTRYLSPPLFPVRLNDLPCMVHLHEMPCGIFDIGEFRVSSTLICHPGPTVGYRLSGPSGSLAYMPDHEPALGVNQFPLRRDWTSGYGLAEGVDLLLHDSQYTEREYNGHVGWGHSAMPDVRAFAALAGVKHLVPIHHDPDHDDATLDRLMAENFGGDLPFAVTPGREGLTFHLGAA